MRKRPVTNNRLAQDFDVCSLLQFAFPTMIMMLFMGLYTIGDTIFISRFVHTNALSAMNIVCPIINIIVGLGTMLATGGSALVARQMGAGEEKKARQSFTLLISVGAIVGICITVLGIVFLDTIIWTLGASEILYPYCRAYLFLLLLFTPASVLQILFQSFIVTAGRPGLGMFLSISAGALNVLLDYLFMVPLQMGIGGSALGTGIGYMMPAIIGFLFFRQNKDSLHFSRPNIDWHALRESCWNGSSEMVSQIAMAITTFLFNITMMTLLGENGVAAITIMIYSQFFLTTLYIGFSMGIAPIISFNHGRHNRIQLKKIMHISFRFIGIVSILVFAMAMVGHSTFISLFSPIETEVYRLTKEGFLIFSFSFLFCGFNIFASATFTALSNGKISAFLSFLRTFGFITVGLLLLPIFLGVTGVWLAVPCAEFFTFFLSCRFLLFIPL